MRGRNPICTLDAGLSILKMQICTPNEAVDFLVEAAAAAAGKPGSCQAVPVMKGEFLCNNM